MLSGDAADHDRALAGRRARACLRAVTARRLYSGRQGLFGSRSTFGCRRYESLWPFANAWAAACILAALPGRPGEAAAALLPRLRRGLDAYRRPDPPGARGRPGPAPVDGFESQVVPPLGSGGDVYHDDNAWIGLAAVAHHERTGDPDALALAGGLLTTTTGGWSTDAGWACRGGIRWKASPATTSRNTCANAPVAELALRVHHHTGDPAALEWGIRLYRWVREALLGPDDLYADRIDPGGRLERTAWSYNQGAMVGAGVLLHETTGNPVYLDQAAATAGAALGRFEGATLLAQGPAFNAIYFRNLWLLDRYRPDPRIRRSAAAFAQEMWRRRRSPWTGLFTGPGSPLNRSAPMMALYALLAGAPGCP